MAIKNALEAAKQLQQSGDLAAAEPLYQEMLTENPKNIDALHGLAILYAQKKDFISAEKKLMQALQLQPKNFRLHLSMGNIFLKQKKSELAEKEFKKVIELEPCSAVAYSNLGNLYFQEKKWGLAEKNYQEAIALNPHFADAFFNYATLLAELDQENKAKEILENNLKNNPYHAPTLGQLAQLALKENDFATAKKYFLHRIELDPQHANAHHDAGLLLLQEGDVKSAIIFLRRAIELGTDQAEAHFNYAVALLQDHQENEALKYFLQQLSKGAHLQSAYNVGVILMNQQRHKEAEEYFEMILNKGKEPRASATGRERSELIPGAVATDEGSEARGVGNEWYIPSLLNLAALALKTKNPEKAVQYYKKVQALDPHNTEVEYILAGLEQTTTPHQASPEYVEHLFDQYAERYDQHLQQYLRYNVPEQLLKLILSECEPDFNAWNILDLGCGTGLAGLLWKPYAKKIIGVDLSENMLVVAREKNIYDELFCCDIHTFKTDEKFDLVIAADVLTYLGDLKNIFLHCKEWLYEKGIFAFSVEKTAVFPFHLQTSLRYAHSEKYLRDLLNETGFRILRFENAILRKEHSDNVEGYLVLCTTRASARGSD